MDMIVSPIKLCFLLPETILCRSKDAAGKPEAYHHRLSEDLVHTLG